MTDRYAVAIVADPEFGDELLELAKRVSVWVCASPTNRAAAQRFWAAHPGGNFEPGVTTFEYDTSDSPDIVVTEILEAVDLHHGADSHDPPLSVIEIYGATPTDHLKSRLADLGFHAFSDTPKGFICMGNAA